MAEIEEWHVLYYFVRQFRHYVNVMSFATFARRIIVIAFSYLP